MSGGTLYAGGYFTTAGGNAGQLHRAMEREQLVGARFGDEHQCAGAGGVGRHVVCRRLFHDGGRQRGQLHRAMEREQLVAAGFGDGRGIALCLRWRCRAARLYAGGYFTTAGGNAANNIAQWDGSGWSALGSGVGGDDFYPYTYPRVDALAVSGGKLYAGGWFMTAGTNVSVAVAEAIVGGAPGSVAIITTNAAFGFTNGVFRFRPVRPVRFECRRRGQHQFTNLDAAANQPARQRPTPFLRFRNLARTANASTEPICCRRFLARPKGIGVALGCLRRAFQGSKFGVRCSRLAPRIGQPLAPHPPPPSRPIPADRTAVPP